jgi:hypothetical protein
MKIEIITIIISAITGSLATMVVQYILKVTERIKRARDTLVECQNYLNECLQIASDNRYWCTGFCNEYGKHNILCCNPRLFPEFLKIPNFLDIELINIMIKLQTYIKHTNQDLEVLNERRIFFNDNFLLNNINEERFSKNLSKIEDEVSSLSEHIKKIIVTKLHYTMAYVRISLRKSNKKSIYMWLLMKLFSRFKPTEQEISEEIDVIKSEIEISRNEHKKEIEDKGMN